MQPFGEAVGKIAAARPDVEVRASGGAASCRRDRARAPPAGRVRPKIVRGEAEKFAAFRRAHAALAASGTVTLELGLAGVPMVVAYRVDPVARLRKPFISVPSIVLTNLVLGENAVPEFLDADGSPEVLARETLALLSDGAEAPGAGGRRWSGWRRGWRFRTACARATRRRRSSIEAAEHGAGRRGGGSRSAPPGPAIRARLSSRPSATSTSKIGGDAALPVSAARSGCATLPSFTPSASAKARTACSSVAASQATARAPPRAARGGLAPPRRASAAAFSSSASGRSGGQEPRRIEEVDERLRALLQCRQQRDEAAGGSRRALPRRPAPPSISGRIASSRFNSVGVVGRADVVAVQALQLARSRSAPRPC